MKKKTAAFLLLGVCVVLAFLLLTRSISPLAGGLGFAFALLLLGGLSRGFRNNAKQ